MHFKRGLILLLLASLPFQLAANDEVPDFVEWQSPLPRFLNQALSADEITDIIGDGQMVIVHPPKNIMLWSKGKVSEYKNTRVATAVMVLDIPVKELQTLMSDSRLMAEIMPQVQNSKTLATQKNETMVEYLQVYDMPGPVDLKAKFIWQYKLEADGSISFLLHEGDIDAAVGQWEFAALDNKRSLLAFTYWGDLQSASFAFKILVNAMPELYPTIPAATTAMYTEIYRHYINKDTKQNRKEMSNEGLPQKPSVPVISESKLKLETLEQLSTLGTLILIHPEQLVQGKDFPQDIFYVSTFVSRQGSPEELLPLISDMSKLTESSPNWVKRADKTENDQGYTVVDLVLMVAVGPVGVKTRNEIHEIRYNEHTVLLDSKGGDLDPLTGAWEFLAMKNPALNKDHQQTLVVNTLQLDIGESAGVMLKMLRNVPMFDLITALHISLTLQENQSSWLAKSGK